MPTNPLPAKMPQRSKRYLELFILVVSLALVFFIAARTPLDSDMWWHLSTGKQIFTSGNLRTPDVFSYTRPGIYWLDHSWLPDVGMYLMFIPGGFTALGIFVAVAAVLSLAVLWFQLEGSALFKAFLLLLAGIVASGNWSPRPQVLTLVMMAVTGLVLYWYKWKGKNKIWLLPILALVWANLHAGFLVLFMLIGLIIAGDVLNNLLGIKGEHVLSWKAIRNLALWGMASALAVNINPNGFLLWLAPLRQNVGVSLALPLITEWASPDFHNPFFIPFLVMIFGMIAAMAHSGRRTDLTDLLTFCWFTGMTLISQRNVGVFAMASAPILGREISAVWDVNKDRVYTVRIRSWFEERFPSKKSGPSRFRGQHALNLFIFGVLALVGIGKLVYATSPALVNTYMTQFYPVRAVAWIKGNKPLGNIFNEYNWGGYLTWYLPSFPVFIDGRVDPYGNEIIGQWISVVKADPGWQSILDKWDIHLILLEPDRPLVRELSGAGWHLLYQDQVSVLYGR
jgi:hypothetical protein